MTGRIYHIRPEQVPALVPNLNPALVEYANASSELYCGLYDAECICIMGLIPRSFISDTAYIWLHMATDAHRLAFARHARRFVADALSRYSTLIGHCQTPSAQRWLLSLGARFTPLANSILQFEIKSWTLEA